MENNSKLHLSVIVLIIIIIGSVWYFTYQSHNKPYQVLTPDVYDEGTTVALYKNTPEGFPKEVILEGKELNYSGVVTTPDGKKKISVSYISEQKVDPALAFYKNELSNMKWRVSDRSTSFTTAIILAQKGDQSVIITFAPDGDKTLVTFQYEQ